MSAIGPYGNETLCPIAYCRISEICFFSATEQQNSYIVTGPIQGAEYSRLLE